MTEIGQGGMLALGELKNHKLSTLDHSHCVKGLRTRKSCRSEEIDEEPSSEVNEEEGWDFVNRKLGLKMRQSRNEYRIYNSK